MKAQRLTEIRSRAQPKLVSLLAPFGGARSQVDDESSRSQCSGNRPKATRSSRQAILSILMGKRLKWLVGGALVAGALFLGVSPAGGTAGEPITAVMTRGIAEFDFFDLTDPEVVTCDGVVFDDRDDVASFRAEFPIDCFDGFLIDGPYDPFEPTEVLIDIEIEGSFVAIPFQDMMAASELVGDEAYVFRPELTSCSALLFEVVPIEDGREPFRQGFDLSCDTPEFDVLPFSRIASFGSGHSVDVGDKAYVSSRLGDDSDPRPSVARGSVFVHENRTSRFPTRLQATELVSSDLDERFGESVATNSAGVVVVGDPSSVDSPGSVYVYTPSGEDEYQESRLQVSDTGLLGLTVDLADNGFLVASDGTDTYVFAPSGTGGHLLLQTLEGETAQISQNGQYLVTRTFQFFQNSIVVQVFEQSNGAFLPRGATITASTPSGLGRGGITIGNDGTAVVAETSHPVGSDDAPTTPGGALHIYGLGEEEPDTFELPVELQDGYGFPFSVGINRDGSVVTRARAVLDQGDPFTLRYDPDTGGRYQLGEQISGEDRSFSQQGEIAIFDDGTFIEGAPNASRVHSFYGEAGRRVGFLSGPLGTGIAPEEGTFIVPTEFPSDPTYSECLANVTFADVQILRICFLPGEIGELSPRDNYLAELVSVERPEDEAIWIGNFAQEAVAP